MHISDIWDAIASSDTSGLEEAFKTLVLWPGYDRLPDTSGSQRKDLLDQVCGALQESGRLMPGDLVDCIVDTCETLDDTTYASGSIAVQAQLGHFRANLDRGGH